MNNLISRLKSTYILREDSAQIQLMVFKANLCQNLQPARMETNKLVILEFTKRGNLHKTF